MTSTASNVFDEPTTDELFANAILQADETMALALKARHERISKADLNCLNAARDAAINFYYMAFGIAEGKSATSTGPLKHHSRALTAGMELFQHMGLVKAPEVASRAA